MSCIITATDFKTQFDRGGFDYGTVVPDIRDGDIDKAIVETEAVINEDLYPTDAICKLAKLYLTAHFLIEDIERDDSGGQTKGIQSSRSVGSISESVTIPEWMLEAGMSDFATTSYGQKFLTLSRPYLGGAVYSVAGGTGF